MNNTTTTFSCIILAGGEGKRVDGRDKGLINFQGKPLIQHVLDAVSPQVDEIIISANRNIKQYADYGYKVVSDATNQYHGPLAGIAATLPACRHNWVLVVPCDMPFLPADLIATLAEDLTHTNLSIAESENRLQLVFLIHKNLAPSLQQSLQNEQLKLMQWIKSQQPAIQQNFKHSYFQNFNHAKDLL